MRGLLQWASRPQEQAARTAGQSASLAPLRFSGRCGVSPHEGVGGDSVAAPAQGKAFPFRWGDFVPVMFAFLRHSIMVT